MAISEAYPHLQGSLQTVSFVGPRGLVEIYEKEIEKYRELLDNETDPLMKGYWEYMLEQARENVEQAEEEEEE